MIEDTRHWLRSLAGEQGFAACRIATPDAIGEPGTRLAHFIELGRHGDMTWLAETAAKRADPRLLWPEVRAIVLLSWNYGPQTDPLADIADPHRGVISCYAQGKDYHEVIKPRLIAVTRALDARTGTTSRVYVDTAPVMEKPLAAAAGLGWQGKHTNLVTRTEGSWTFLSAIFTTAALEPDQAHSDHCGTCQRCLDICPTKAFPAPYQLDATRCIAYLTIEHKGHIPREFRRAIANRIFGCDDCLAVCPWNSFARQAEEIRLHPRTGSANPPIAELLQLDDASFRQRFQGTPVRRTGRDRFLRNVLIAAGNTRDRSYLPLIEPHLRDPSALVRAAAVWALREIVSASEVSVLRANHLPAETDASVIDEWTFRDEAGSIDAPKG